jgi:hypothetical protein
LIFLCSHAPLQLIINNFIIFIFVDDVKSIAAVSSPSLVVISRPSVNLTSQPVSFDLSKTNIHNNNNSVPLTTLSNGTNSITIFNIDESQASLNLSTESSGYVSSTTSSLGNVSLNQSGINGDDLDIEVNNGMVGKNTPPTTLILDQHRLAALQTPQTTFNALPMPTTTPLSSAGRRRTISSNSNRYFINFLVFQ